MATTYQVTDEDGYQLTTGLQAHEARTVAQRIADARAESVWLSDETSASMGDEIAPTTQTATHTHSPFAHHGQTFRCACGATAPTGDGFWTTDDTTGCTVCAAPTTRQDGLCEWHADIDIYAGRER